MPKLTIGTKEFKNIILKFNNDSIYETDEREQGKEDLEFADGKGQWDKTIEKAREERPCLVLNRIDNHVNRIAGEQLMNRMNIKVIPVDDKADPDTAKIKEGLIRNIEYESIASRIYHMGYKGALISGRGAWRINKDYVNNETWDQELGLELIENPYTVYLDSVNQLNPNHIFITSNIPIEEYNRKYKDTKKIFATDSEFNEAAVGDFKEWIQDDERRIAEYFWKEVTSDGFLYLVKNRAGMKTTRDMPKNKRIEKKREIFKSEIWHIVLSSDAVLEKPIKWDGDSIPVVMVWGKEINIDGQRKIHGMVYNVKDSQRAYNYERSAWVETVALAPKEHWLVTEFMVNGHETQWSDAQKGKKLKYLTYNIDPNVPDGGRPVRISPSAVPVGLERSAAFSAQEIKDIDGVHETSLGERSNETSGIAIENRSIQSGISNYVYTSNLILAMRQTGQKLLNLIPKTYDTKRTIRITGIDDKEVIAKINQRKGADMTKGRYDCRISAGPAFATQRLEAVEQINKFYQVAPDAAPLTWDIMARNLSWHGSEEFSERLKKAVPINIRGADEGEEVNEQELSQEIQQQMAEAQKLIDESKFEQERAKIEQAKAIVEQAEAAVDLEKVKVEAEKVESQVKVFKAEVKAIQAGKGNNGGK